MYRAKIEVTLRPSILDPQGKATRHALHNLGYTAVEEVRIGKLIEMHIDAATKDAAHDIAEAACRKLVANEVMENYSIVLTKMDESKV
ncbi:MAG: phosphoribosylformylglycinamidine synthase subunit PurS [Rhodothermales bacterium]|nr:phosphoribosylformylglycinamidine synthase subunit PurS [Rhodothermales bacterium]